MHQMGPLNDYTDMWQFNFSIVDHRVLWKFKALWSFLLDDLNIIGHPNVKQKSLHRAKTFLTPLF